METVPDRTQLRKIPYAAPGQMEATAIDPLINPQWDRWVQSHASGSIFHTSLWARVLAKTYGHRPHYLRFSNFGKTVALVPLMEVRSLLTGRRGVSVPFSDACAPLLFDENARGKVLEKLSNLAWQQQWKYLELRGALGVQTDLPSSVEFLGHRLALDADPQRLFDGFSSATRRAIRKAERSGLTIQIGTAAEAMAHFYRLHCVTRRRHGVPPQPWSFFRNIHEEIMRKESGFIVLAFKDLEPVAGAVFFHFARNAVYKFGASLNDHPELRANNLVMWQAIKHLSESGIQSLDFGRTSCTNQGLRRFKQDWGTREDTLSYFKLETATGQWIGGRDNATGFHNAFFKKLPLAVNRLAGLAIYPHLD